MFGDLEESRNKSEFMLQCYLDQSSHSFDYFVPEKPVHAGFSQLEPSKDLMSFKTRRLAPRMSVQVFVDIWGPAILPVGPP